MSNNLKKLEKDLRSYAKRCKDIKYSSGLLLTFLLTGMLTLPAATSVTNNNIEQQRQSINNSISDMRTTFRRAKAENNKLLKGANLELIQLMEQGDQVVKSPWSSWQFGLNYFYNKWGGTFKGRGDKAEKYPYEGIFTRSTDTFERVTSPLSEGYSKLSVSTNPYSAASSQRQGLTNGYGIASTTPRQEPISTLNVDASIKPKDVYRDPVPAPTVTVQAPQLQALNVPNLLPPAVDVPEPDVPQKQVSIVQPNASPFTGFFFNSTASAVNVGNSNMILYAGVTPGSWNSSIVPVAQTGAIDSATNSTIATYNGRPTNILYRSGNTGGTASLLSNLDLYVRGYFDGTQSDQITSGGLQDSYTDSGSGNSGGSDTTGGATRGTIGIHTLLNVDVSNVTANLYGRAGFLTSETWRNGTVTMSNTTVNVYNDQNSVYYIMPSAYGTIAHYLVVGGNSDNFYIGGLKGAPDVNLYGTGNSVYLSAGISGARHIENDGNIVSDGASNIVYSGLSYVPTWANTWFQTRGGTVTRANQSGYTDNVMQSVIKLGTGSGSVNLYGDENVGLFFGSKMGGSNPKSWEIGHRNAEDSAGYIRRASYIGIYQGEIDLNAQIGTATSSTGAAQTAGNLSGKDANLVEGAVGVFVQSGQRAGISPTRDLGVPVNASGSVYANIGTLENDTIHALRIGKLNVTFGSKSKDGFMIISKLGSHVEVADPGVTNTYIGTASTLISDGINGAGTSSADASTGTVIAYSEGTWDQAQHQLGSNAAYLTANDSRASGSTAAALQGKESQIDIYAPVVLASKEGIAYMGDNKGIVNAKGASTTAVNNGSIIGFARNGGTVNIDGTAIAKDANVTNNTLKYQNIAGLATLDTAALPGASTGGTVNIAGAVDIHGMGGLASGTGSVVNLNNTGNRIRTGSSGALAAVDGGKVNFAGGTITHTENVAGDHDSSAPMYADSSSGIYFTGATTIDMSHGILMPGTASDYAASASGTTRYNGMSNVTVNLTGDNVILSTNNGATTNWTGSTSGSTAVKTDMKLTALNTGSHTYKIYYINGIFNLNNNLNLDDATDEFNKSLGLSNEVFNIASGVTVSSAAGNGLAMGSNNSATTNATNSYVNKGTINITGGNLASGKGLALNMSYGTVDNQNIINVDNGIGAYGINGSKLLNNTDGKITVSNGGVGMAAFASASTGLQTYGTDRKISDGTLTTADKVLEIENKGTVTVAGDSSIGLYGEMNNPSSSTLLTVANGRVANSGKIVMTGKNAVGIVSKGNIVELSGTGSSDISVGENGIGVYIEGGPVNLLSNYGIEVKDNGTGIFVKDGSQVSPGTLELKYSGSNTGTGVGIFYENTSSTGKVNFTNINLADTTGTTGGLVGLYVEGPGAAFNNSGTITGDKGYGIITKGTEIVNNNTITLNNPVDGTANPAKASVGIYTQASDKITNNSTITVGEKSVGIYGAAVDNTATITVGNSGTGIYSSSGNVNLTSTSVINTGVEKAVAVYTGGSSQSITAASGAVMTIGDTSFGFINEGNGNILTSNIVSQSLGNDAVFIYSNDTAGTITNNTSLTSTGSYNYGVYSAGTVTNNADINFNAGLGNVGIYSTHGGTATNTGGRNITVGASYIDPNGIASNNRYAVGMAAGFTPNDAEIASGKTPYSGNIVNEGTLNVTGENSIGMYGTGTGTKVYNGTSSGSSAVINLNASNTTGIYLDNGAYGYNYGVIRSNGPNLKKVIGVVVKNGSTIENHGRIEISASDARGILAKGDVAGNNLGIIKNYGTFVVTGSGSQDVQEDANSSELGKSMGGIKIDVPAGSTVATITVNGSPVIPEVRTTTAEEYKEMEVSTIGMYIDTSGKRFTTPVAGLSELSGLTKADLIIGTEAAQDTTGRYIQISEKILEPYNTTIRNNPQIENWKIYSGSLTWMAEITQNQTTGVIENAYLAKIPYTQWAGTEATPVESTDTYNFLDGLEQRYGVEALGTRENQLFQKLNSIGNNEEILFYQAIDEMMGHQYANTQQRINSTGNVLDKEFSYLRNDWSNPSKESNKIKVFGSREEYNTDTAGVIDYTSKSYGVAYVHEDETIKLGEGTGWYAGYVQNRFRFKDIGKSKENQNMLKAGVFKTKAFDDNGSLKWTISGEGFIGQNDMKRRYLVVDEIFNAKGTYYTYGVGVKNEISKEFRTSERTSIKPYGALELEYGRFNSIKEKDGEMRLEVKGNDYYSIKPEVGVEFKYKQPMAVKTNLTASLGVAYENELGKVNDVKNKARVRYTSADWFNIRGDKEDRRGNFKADFKLGIENTRFGITLNAGYDTKGENFRGGIGLRAIY